MILEKTNTSTKLLLGFTIFVLIFFQFPKLAYNQIPGCTDPNSLNYNESATANDGSCIYAYSTTNPTIHINGLPSQVSENSGLIFWNENFWTHNDSGGAPEIYKLDSLTGNIIQTITIGNGVNTDWEDLAQDDYNIYIGDVGNNSGSRTDLKIYKIAKSAIPDAGDATVAAGIISYQYSDQTNFTPAYNNTNFDCEAIIADSDSIFLFTKDWINGYTKLYALCNRPGTYIANLCDSMDVGGLITGASYLYEKNQIVLTGYTNNPPTYYPPFMWLLFDFGEENFFDGHKRKITFPLLFGVQVEGVAFYNSNVLYFSCEQNSAVDSRIYKTNPAQWTGNVLYAWFTTNADTIFPNGTVLFSDFSNGAPSAWNWIFNGGLPSNSSNQNPGNITYAQDGSFDVTLKVFAGNRSNVRTRKNLIHVLPPLISLHEIEIPQGWSGISSYLTPADSLLEHILLPLEGNLQFFGNQNHYFGPGQPDGLTYWSSQGGYFIKLNSQQEIYILGYPDNKDFHFPSGWFIMPVLSDQALATSAIPEMSNNKIVIIKEIAGVNVWWPDMDINTLTMLYPGKAYLVFANEAGTLSY